jgi:ribosome-binding ATPase YchF (GTP1/OBG family)
MVDEYARGIQDQRLHDHDKHFDRINGSIADSAQQLRGVKEKLSEVQMTLQRLTDAVESNQKIVITTAAAVESERKSTADAVEQQRTTLRDSTESKWSPLTRISVVIGILVGLATLIGVLLSLNHL